MNKIINMILKEAEIAYKNDEVPVGCVIVRNNIIISKGHNSKQKKHMCTRHAEVIAIEKASKKLKDWRLTDCELYVTLEPCPMCKEVIRQARIKKVYYLLKSNFNNENNKIIEYSLIESYDNANYKEKLSSFFEHKR